MCLKVPEAQSSIQYIPQRLFHCRLTINPCLMVPKKAMSNFSFVQPSCLPFFRILIRLSPHHLICIMDHLHAKTVIIALGATITLAFSLRHLRENRNRTRKILKHDERVLILGASSGIGRAIAHLYAQRGARVCVVGRRGAAIDVVEQECKTIQRIKETPDDKSAFSFKGDISNPEDMIMLRDVLALGTCFRYLTKLQRLIWCSEWQGIDTVILTAGVASLQPLLTVANLKHDSDHVELEGVQRAFDVAQNALRSNYLGHLVSAVTFVWLL